MKDFIRVGIVSSINPATCTARVAFGDRANVVSFDLPVLVRGSLKNKDYWLPDPGEQVVCLFLPSGNAQGFILGSIYSQKDMPPIENKDKRYIVFDDGTIIEYDRATHTLTIDAVKQINISAPKGINISATDPAGSGVQINGKTVSEGW